MWSNDFFAMQMHKIRENELMSHNVRPSNRALVEIINEFKAERSRRSRKERRG
jgi:hypothetical protein